MPTAVATDLTANNLSALNLHITNWNRRLLAIDSIECEEGFRIFLDDATVNGGHTLLALIDQGEGRSIEPNIHLGGWEDRSRPPSNAVFNIRVFVADEESLEFKRRNPGFIVHGRLLGETIAPISVSVVGDVATF